MGKIQFVSKDVEEIIIGQLKITHIIIWGKKIAPSPINVKIAIEIRKDDYSSKEII